ADVCVLGVREVVFLFSSHAAAPPEGCTLSLHDALPIWVGRRGERGGGVGRGDGLGQRRRGGRVEVGVAGVARDQGVGSRRQRRGGRRITRLNFSHVASPCPGVGLKGDGAARGRGAGRVG